jgi:hypothetical protein
MPLDSALTDQHIHRFPCHLKAPLPPYHDVIHLAHFYAAGVVQVVIVRPALDGTGLSTPLHSVGKGTLSEAWQVHYLIRVHGLR